MAETIRRYPIRISGYFTAAQQKRLERHAWKTKRRVAEVLRDLVDSLPAK